MIKFSCEKVLLQSAIAVASRAVAQKSSIPRKLPRAAARARQPVRAQMSPNDTG